MLNIAYSIAELDFEATRSMGIYNISLGLLDSLASNAQVDHIHLFANKTLTASLPESEKVTTTDHAGPTTGVINRLLWEQWGVYQATRAADCSWLILPKGFAPILRRCPVKLAAYVHDIMALFYADRYPVYSGKTRQSYFQAGFKAALKQANVILTNTQFSKSEIKRWSKSAGVSCPAIEVVGYGFAAQNNQESKKDMVLMDVRAAPHKRTDLALQYMERWQEETGYSGRIVAIGTLPPYLSFPEDKQWSFLGRVTPDKYKAVMGQARACIHFTEYEGFGMPPVEAILAGTSSVFSDIPVSREVMHHTGQAFRNDSYSSFKEALSTALATPPETIKTWQETLLRNHSWFAVSEAVVRAVSSYA